MPCVDKRCHEGFLFFFPAFSFLATDQKDVDVPLVEALTGFTTVIQHLDGRFLTVKGDSQEIVKPGDWRVVHGEGMPLGGSYQTNRMQKGNLYLRFNVVFPTPRSLTPAAQDALKSLLPAQPVEERGMQVDSVVPSERDMMDAKKGSVGAYEVSSTNGIGTQDPYQQYHGGQDQAAATPVSSAPQAAAPTVASQSAADGPGECAQQ